jgi:transcriptional regulator with XRE-family HTH domain
MTDSTTTRNSAKTAAEFNAAQQRHGISRREFARRIGIAPNSATSYAFGRKPIPLTVVLAIAAVEAGIGPRPEVLKPKDQ